MLNISKKQIICSKKMNKIIPRAVFINKCIFIRSENRYRLIQTRITKQRLTIPAIMRHWLYSAPFALSTL